MSIRLDGQVAVVTGAGNGLGKAHALLLAERGAKVVVNDLGQANGAGSPVPSPAALDVVNLIQELGGEAIAHGANVANSEQVKDMIEQAMSRWGRIDILVNNAGNLRDMTFSKMTLEDFRAVIDVHLIGAFNCSKAVWEIMREQNYGRIVMTTSGSGMYGNFGQSNYGAAKMGVIGLMNTLVLEGGKNNIRVNALAPSAGTSMTEGLLPEDLFSMMAPESVAAGLLTLCSQDAPNRQILCAGGGGFASTHIYETPGVFVDPQQLSPETVLQQYDAIFNPQGEKEMQSGVEQANKFIAQAAKHCGIDIPAA